MRRPTVVFATLCSSACATPRARAEEAVIVVSDAVRADDLTFDVRPRGHRHRGGGDVLNDIVAAGADRRPSQRAAGTAW
ncbi:MAG: hypothetical protein U0802_13130 [Candidatus Binatia bacterium]